MSANDRLDSLRDPLAEARALIEALLEDQLTPMTRSCSIAWSSSGRMSASSICATAPARHPPAKRGGYGSQQGPGPDGGADDSSEDMSARQRRMSRLRKTNRNESVSAEAIVKRTAAVAVTEPSTQVRLVNDGRQNWPWRRIIPLAAAGLAACVVLAIVLHRNSSPEPIVVALPPPSPPVSVAYITAPPVRNLTATTPIPPARNWPPVKSFAWMPAGWKSALKAGRRRSWKAGGADADRPKHRQPASRQDRRPRSPEPEASASPPARSSSPIWGPSSGLSVNPTGEAAVDVFFGKSGRRAQSRGRHRNQDDHLAQGQAVVGSTVNKGPIQPSKSGAQDFVRDIAKLRRPIH